LGSPTIHQLQPIFAWLQEAELLQRPMGARSRKPPFPFRRADEHRSCFFPNRDLETTRLSALTSTFPEAPRSASPPGTDSLEEIELISILPRSFGTPNNREGSHRGREWSPLVRARPGRPEVSSLPSSDQSSCS